jgi:hypothetical protein
MPGRAYNPLGYEPDLHGELCGPPAGKARELLTEVQHLEMEKYVKGKPIPYDKAYEFLKRGEGDVPGHYVYEMMYDVYAGMEDELLQGCVDTHLHIYPDYVPRTTDIIRFAIDCSRAGYRAIVCKDHFFTNVGMAWAAQWVCEFLQRKGVLKHACKVFGTHVLAWSFDPEQIDLIRKYPNLGGVFFPTFTGAHPAGHRLPIIDDKGKITAEAKACIDRMAKYHICIFTGHAQYAETKAMVEYAHEAGAHILCTHSGGRWPPTQSGTYEQTKALIKLGAWIEWPLDHVVGGGGLFPISDMTQVTSFIKAMGPENVDHLVCGSDLGQPSATHPIEGARLGARMLLHSGIPMEHMKLMYQKNGADAIFLDEKETEVYTRDPFMGPEDLLVNALKGVDL